MKVRIQGQDAVGEVLELTGKKSDRRLRPDPYDYRPETARSHLELRIQKVTRSLRPTTASSASYDTAERRVHFSQQIDVRGMRASEALDATQEFIDDAIMLGFSEVRILHGKGTGALKEEIRKYLRTVDLVASAKDEHEESGGAGITVVRLEL